ncbi:MAG: exo-alpha-sialidase [Bryobacteraceae bacterium]
MVRSILLLSAAATLAAADPRNITSGSVIPDEGYADQPYIVKTDDGAWLCVITTGPGQEGAGGQHIVTRRSTDRGRTWTDLVDVEPSSGPEASYAVLLKVPYGRVYVFYNHNTDNVREVIGDKPAYRDGKVRRVDSLGHFVFKYSDDHGRSWSARRYDIAQRDFEIDRRNPYQGKLKFFWNVGKAFSHRGAGYVPLHKVGGFGEGFFTSNEGVLLRSANILTERDAAKLTWETLPEGDRGIRAPEGGGTVAAEHSFSELSDGSLFCVFRTIDGHAAHTYSRDGGRTWEPSQYMRYADGRLMKHPRAANFAWRASNGKFLYWFHNHGGRFIREHPRRRSIAYEDRNPVWLSGGEEADSPRGKVILWNEPEIVLYDDDPVERMSYPDFVEEDGHYYLTETQKEIARVHEVDPKLIEGLWNQGAGGVAGDGLLGAGVPLPAFARRKPGGHGAEDLRGGFTLDLWVRFGSFPPNRVFVDNRGEDGKGIALATVEGGAVELVMNDGRMENRWRSDRGALSGSGVHHVVAIVDGGPKIISFVVDGRLNDGGEERQFGWGRFSPYFRGIEGGAMRKGEGVLGLRMYGRALRTSEAVGNYRAGAPTTGR